MDNETRQMGIGETPDEAEQVLVTTALLKDERAQSEPPEEPAEIARYVEADEHLLTIANDLIKRHHEHLMEARITYRYRTTDWNRKGKPQRGTVELVNDKYRAAGIKSDFLMIVNRGLFRELEPTMKYAVVDDLLSRCEKESDSEGNPKWVTVEPDLVGFVANVKRYGFWSEELKLLHKESCSRLQAELPGVQEAAATSNLF